MEGAVASAAAIGIGIGFQAHAVAVASPIAGTLDRVADALRAYAAAGAAEAIIDWPAPFDAETLERLAVLAA